MTNLLRPRPIRPRSDRQQAFERDLATAKREILKRCNNRCELCQCDLRTVRADAHHPFSRHELGAWTNHPACLVVACEPCHRTLTNAATPVAHNLATTAQLQVIHRLRKLARRRSPMPNTTLRLEAIRLTELLGPPR